MSIGLIISVASAIASLAYSGYQAYQAYQMKKRNEKKAAASPSPIPYITESDVIPVVFGTVNITGPAIVEATGPRKSSSDAELSGDDILYWWEWNFVRVVLCHGRIDAAYIRIDSEGVQSLNPSVTDYQNISADGGKTTPQLLLGWLARGDLAPGAPPAAPSSLSFLSWGGSTLRHPSIAYALVHTWRYAITRGDNALFSSKPQFPTEVTWLVQRINYRHGQSGITGWTDTVQWQPSLAMIAPTDPTEYNQMNPAHMLRELLTDRVWGLGLDESLIDETSFAASAQTLFDEGFGLSFLWAQETSAEDFALEILRHIDGLLFQEPSTGQYVLRLVREGSNALFDLTSPSQIISPPEYSRPSYSSLASRVTVINSSLRFSRDTAITVHNLALTEQIGDVPVTIRYDGVYLNELAERIASRDLRRLSTPLATVRMSVTWSAGKDIRNGDRVTWAWPQYGIVSMSLRVVGVTYGELNASSVTLDCIEDVLAPLSSLYATPVPTVYSPPDYTAHPSTHMAVEMPIAFLGFAGAPVVDRSDPRGTVMAAAKLPAINPELHVSWDLMTGGVTRATRVPFAPVFELAADMTLSGLGNGASSVVASTANFAFATFAAYVAMLRRPDGTDEFVQVTPNSASSIILARGLYDTTPYFGTIPSGTVLYVLSRSSALSPTIETAASDGRAYVVGSAVSTEAITRTSQQELAPAAAPNVVVTTANRQIRPTCPGLVSATFASGTGTTITWRRRNRLTNPTCTQTCPDVTPETGTTHRLIIEGLSAATGGVFVQVQNLTLASTVTSYLYTKKSEEDDHAALPGPAAYFDQLRLTLYSTRDGYDSWQRQIRVRT